jgi:hypothetical protein
MSRLPAKENERGALSRSLLTVVASFSLAAAAGAWIMYAPTLGYGFDYDDYHFVRPYAAHEVAAAFSGPWDASAIEVPFYRPLTILFYAIRFHYLGLNSEACHTLSLVMFAGALVLFGLLVRAMFESTTAGAAGMGMLLVHPAMPYAAVAWVTNQMHLLEMLIVLAALLWWTHVRTRDARWWMPLIGFEIAALLVKEDGIMLIPAIVVLHVLRRYLAEPDLRWPPSSFLLAAVAAAAALLEFRHSVLPESGGYRLPNLETAWLNLRTGFESVFRLIPARRPWQRQAGWFVTLLPLMAFVAWRRLPGAARFGLAAGLAIGALFMLPFIFVVKVQQLHLVGMGAALLLTSASVAVVRLADSRPYRATCVLVIGSGALVLAAVARDITRDFEPFGKIILATDDLVTGWAAVPPELREYLAEKKQPGAASRLSSNPAEALSAVAFGLHGWETGPDAIRFRWMASTQSEIYVRPSAQRVTLPLRHEIGGFREPARVEVELDGRIVDAVEFRTGEWRASTMMLGHARVSRLRKMHRIVLRIDRTWTPSVLDPRSSDHRQLGLQVGELQIR